MDSAVLAIDIGTSSMKAALIGLDGTLYAHAGASFHGSRHPASWEDALVEVCNSMAEESSVRPSAIAVSGHGPSLVPLDAGAQVIEPVMFWLDHRSTRVEGLPSFFLPKIRWFLDHHQADERGAKVPARFVSCPEYLLLRLGAEAATVSPHEGFDQYFWTPGQLPPYGVSPEVLPDIRRPTEMLGRSGGSLCARAGLPDGLPLFGGGSDFLMALIGTDTLKDGRCCDRAGSSEGINYCTGAEVRSPSLRTLHHVMPDKWNVASIIPASGMLFEWFRTWTGQKHRTYKEMLTDIRSIGNDADIPFFLPDPSRTGRFAKGAFIGLEQDQGPAHLSRAVVESIAFMVREGLAALSDAGLPCTTLTMCGGQARNEPWCQMKSDILGVPISIPVVSDAELLGNAAVTWTGLGYYGSIEEAAHAMVRTKVCHEPDPEQYKYWSGRYESWLKARDTLSATVLSI